MSAALNRWSATEMRWNRNAVSRSSPVAALNRRPTSARKFSKEQGAIAPRLSLLFFKSSEKKFRGWLKIIIIIIIIIIRMLQLELDDRAVFTLWFRCNLLGVPQSLIYSRPTTRHSLSRSIKYSVCQSVTLYTCTLLHCVELALQHLYWSFVLVLNYFSALNSMKV